MPIPQLLDAERDALTRVCNLGMEHAATALSQLMGKPVSIDVPRLQVMEPGRLASRVEAGQMTALHLQILGKVRGTVLILLRQENARRVLELLLGTLPAPEAPLTES